MQKGIEAMNKELEMVRLACKALDEKNRLFYDLERIWRDGKEVDVEEFLK